MRIVLALVLCALILGSAAAALPPRLISYQGYVTLPNGTPLAGTFDVTVRLYDAPTGGSLLWEETHTDVVVEQGVFSVLLGTGTALTLPFDVQYWLGVSVPTGGPEFEPRTQLASAPYSLRALAVEPDAAVTSLNGLTGMVTLAGGGSVNIAQSGDTLFVSATAGSALPVGSAGQTLRHDGADWVPAGNLTNNGTNVGIGTASPMAKLDVVGTLQMTGLKMPTGATNGYVLTSDASGLGSWQAGSGGDITGVTAGSGLTGGGTSGTVTLSASFGGSGSTTTVSRSDHNHSTVYVAVGDLDHLDASDGSPASALAVDAAGNVGIGTTSPSQKLEVNGSLEVDHIYGRSTSGVLGIRPARTSASPGGAFRIYSKDASDTDVTRMELTGGVATATMAIASSKVTIDGGIASGDQLLKLTNTSNGRGIYAATQATQNTNAAIEGEANNGGGCGIYGRTSSLGVSGGSSLGVYGWAPTSGASVGGAALGVLGRVNSWQGTSASVPTGVFGWATATSGINAGVWGETLSPNGFGVYSAGDLAVDGDMYVNGTKSAVVDVSGEIRKVYCVESTEVWFEDAGSGALSNGRAHIDLDASFLTIVTVDGQHPLQVFVQPTGECSGVFVKKGSTGFDVVEMNGGSGSATFDYRVVAKRKGFEGTRLERPSRPLRFPKRVVDGSDDH